MFLKIKFFLVCIGMMCINGVAFAGDYDPFWKGTGSGKLLTPEVYAAIIAGPTDQLNCSVDAACQSMVAVLTYYSQQKNWKNTSNQKYVFDIGQIKKMFEKRSTYLSEGPAVFYNSPVGRVKKSDKSVDFGLTRNNNAGEMAGYFDPNQLADVDLSSGALEKVQLWSESCGNPLMVGYVSTPVIAGNYKFTSPGNYQIPATGGSGPINLTVNVDASSYSTSTATNTATQTATQTVTQPEEDLDKPGFHPDNSFGTQPLNYPPSAPVSTYVNVPQSGMYPPNAYIQKDRNVFWVGAAGFVAGAIGGYFLNNFLSRNNRNFQPCSNTDYTCWRQPPYRQQYPYFAQYSTPTIKGYADYGNVPTISNVQGLAGWSFNEFKEDDTKQSPFLLNGRISSDIYNKNEWS